MCKHYHSPVTSKKYACCKQLNLPISLKACLYFPTALSPPPLHTHTFCYSIYFAHGTPAETHLKSIICQHVNRPNTDPFIYRYHFTRRLKTKTFFFFQTFQSHGFKAWICLSYLEKWQRHSTETVTSMREESRPEGYNTNRNNMAKTCINSSLTVLLSGC